MLDDNVKKTLGELEIESKPPSDSKPTKQTEDLLSFFEAENPVLFRDEMEEGYVQIRLHGKNVIWSCRSAAFDQYLHHLFWSKTGDLISRENLMKVIKLIRAQAEYGDQQFCLYNRVASLKESIWYDLGDSKAIKCRDGQWELVEDVPILFRSFRHQDVQVKPAQSGGDLRRILQYVRIKKEDHEILFLVWLVSAFVPEIPHPILVLFGEKGASKSTIMRFIRLLIDPSKIGLMTLPAADELVQQLAHHYFAGYDNVNYVSQSVSDILCRGVTGAGASKRRLYTDDEDVIYQFRRIIGLNGINNVVEAPDLLDRSILIDLQRIPKEERKTEEDLCVAFESDRSIILAGIFDVLVKAQAIFQTLRLCEFPRMADYAKWGCAIAEALGIGQDRFLEAYSANIRQQNDEVIENDSVANAIVVLMEKQVCWEGSTSQLLDEILKIGADEKVDPKFLPKNPAVLGKRINIVSSNLLDFGVQIIREKDTGKRRGRYLTITKVEDLTVAPVSISDHQPSVSDASDASDSSDNSCEVPKAMITDVDIKELFGPNTDITTS